MCGIFGYYNYNLPRTRQAIVNILLSGLLRLEYRGYDSAGLAIDHTDIGKAAADKADVTSKPLVVKTEGMIAKLKELCDVAIQDKEAILENHIGIAHTRWATHGAPSAVNSHPQVSDPSHEFIVVHNGVITNHQYIKNFLTKHGDSFVSDTDTEVIPKLCRYLYNNVKTPLPFPKLVMEVMRQLEGAYALLIKSVHYPGEFVACKRGSPLIIGISGDATPLPLIFQVKSSTEIGFRAASMECFLASDASAVIEHTKKVIYLEDNDVLHMCQGNYGIFNTDNSDLDSAVPRLVHTLELEIEEIKKGGYDHYMQKEISEQPASLTQTMRGRTNFKKDNENDYLYSRVRLGGLEQYVGTIKSCRRIVFVACGTSYHACLAARQTIEGLCNIPVVVEVSSDFVDRRCPIFRDDTCVFVSQSGETADTLLALEYCKVKGALLVGMTNTVGSQISRATDCGVHLNAGYEIGVASTKAYGSEVVAMTLMALALSEDSISKRSDRDLIIDDLERLPGKVERVLQLDEAIKALADGLKSEQSLIFLGRGYNYATALEGALKVKEVALIHSEGMLAGEFKHGPLALVDEKLPIVVLATNDSMYNKMLSVVQQLCARGARLIIICNEGDHDLKRVTEGAATFIEVPFVVDALQPIINVIPLQLLSYHLALLRGLDVDRPRHLAKSVTVTEQQ